MLCFWDLVNAASDEDNDVALDQHEHTVLLRFTGGTTANGVSTSADGLYQINTSTGAISLTAAGAASAANDFEQGPTDHSYSVTVVDAAGNHSAAVITLNETNVDEPSVLVADTRTTAEDTPLTVAADAGVLANDSDVDSALSVSSFTVNGTTYTAGTTVSLSGIGLLTMNADGGYQFDPASNYSGAVPTVTYTTTTGEYSTLTINVTPLADAPTLNVTDKTYSLSENFDSFNGVAAAAYSVGSLNNGQSGNGAWLTENADGKIEVGQASDYGVSSGSNAVLEIEAWNPGAAESLYGLATPFTSEQFGATTVYRKSQETTPNL